MTQFEPPKVSILLVDDNESNLLALETILQAEDRNLVRAASGDEALQYLLDNDAAVILLDVRMPGISGLETAELIRGRRKSRDVPIIFLTAYDSVDNADLSRGYSLGAVDYIIKPLDSDALKSKVAVFVELYKKTQQVKQQAELLKEKNIQLENANFERLGKLVELGQQLTAERDPERLLQLFCNASRDIVGARHASVIVTEADGTSVRHKLESGIGEPAAAGKGFCRDANSFSYQSSSSSILKAPIPLPDQASGWLYLVDNLDADEFSEADERLAMTLTGQVAVAYENARLYADAQRHAAELLQEVTERKQAEKEKERLLASEKAARLEAEAANRLKDEFLATVSHELRTPLNAMLGWAALLLEKNLDELGANRAVEIIERNARTLSRLVGDILDASRIITGKLGLDLRPVELVHVVEAAADVLRPAARAKKIRLQVSVSRAGGPIVLGDSDRLQQIVWNLLSNAIKFTPDGGDIQVVLESSGSHAELRVIDTGQGITPDFLPYVFERFRQADSSMTRAHGGLGLGLAIVRHLVDLHGGTAYAESAGKGQGATFVVRIPLTMDEITEDVPMYSGPLPDRLVNQTGPQSERQPAQPVDLTGLHVLIVDDEEDTRDLVTMMIEQHGARVKGVASTVEALATLKQWQPHILLSDIGMAGEDGYDLIRQVRALDPERGGNIPAAAMTAYASAEDRLRALSAGYESHIAKPIDQEQLVALVANLAGRSDKPRV